jgi:hypothetical protein
MTAITPLISISKMQTSPNMAEIESMIMPSYTGDVQNRYICFKPLNFNWLGHVELIQAGLKNVPAMTSILDLSHTLGNVAMKNSSPPASAERRR